MWKQALMFDNHIRCSKFPIHTTRRTCERLAEVGSK